jgi:hypothetical protein
MLWVDYEMTKNYDEIRQYCSYMHQAVQLKDKELIKEIMLSFQEQDLCFNGLEYLRQTWEHLTNKAHIIINE